MGSTRSAFDEKLPPVKKPARRGPPQAEVLYQIFPDRFARAEPIRAPKRGAWRWHGHSVRTSRNLELLTEGESSHYTFYGGNLAGIRARLGHLRALGVTGIYLNPIFHARSTHRYDAVDYLAVDPVLGTRADFEALVADLRRAGMKIYLDAVFNHTSIDHPRHRVPEKRRRYYLMQSKTKAMRWMAGRTLPKLDLENPEVQEYFLRVLDAWKEADGWRLDAAHLWPRAFLARLKRHLGGKPVVVEDWTHAGHYFRDGLADGVMNFLFKEAVCAFVIEDLSPETFLERIAHVCETYPPEALRRSWTFLENHDTKRFASVVPFRRRLFVGYALLFTLPGTPVIFQGGEFGMKGDTAGASRAPVVWDRRKWDRALFERVRRLVRLRLANKVLAEGDFHPLYARNRDRTLAFERRVGRERAVVAVNDGYFHARFSAGGEVFSLPPGGYAVRFSKR